MIIPQLAPAALWTFRRRENAKVLQGQHWQLEYKPQTHYKIVFTLGYSTHLFNVIQEIKKKNSKDFDSFTMRRHWAVAYPNEVRARVIVPYTRTETYELRFEYPGIYKAMDIEESLVSRDNPDIKEFWEQISATQKEFPL